MHLSTSCGRKDSRVAADDGGIAGPGLAEAPARTYNQHTAFRLNRRPHEAKDPVYTLYYAPGTASMVVHLALLEIGAPYRLELVDLDASRERDPAYLRLNPQGTVPTLVVDDRVLTESAALLMVLADRVRARPSWKRLYELEGLTEW